ncbi:MAG: GyrI-like domain-containing protein [Anaerolineae bacterium]|nr:GyrI-like domain-containing protein [Anaerolineae bacterium]
MIRIGDFSKLAYITVKTLHHYGEIGLLRPAHIDRYTGYRYYALEQLPRLNRILALKDLGFSLEQIANLLDEELSLGEMRGMLRMKQLELTERVDLEQMRLAQVELRLRQIEQEGQLPKHEIALKEIPPMMVLAAKTIAASAAALPEAWRSLQMLLTHNLERARLKMVGPWFALVADLPYAENDQAIELAIPVQVRRGLRAGDWGNSLVKLRELDAVPNMASSIYEGEHATLNLAYTALYAWTKANAYQIVGPCREVYLSGMGIAFKKPDESSGFVEVQCPVERTRVPISVISTQTYGKELVMQPKFVTKPAMTVVGLSYVGKNENNEIPQLWGQWNMRAGEIKNRTGFCAYGACFAAAESAGEGEFEYVACIEVSEIADIPDGMLMRQIPAHKYAVFTHKGKLHTLPDTYKYIYETWLPQSGLELHEDKFDMELYDERFVLDSDSSEFDILVAIKE